MRRSKILTLHERGALIDLPSDPRGFAANRRVSGPDPPHAPTSACAELRRNKIFLWWGFEIHWKTLPTQAIMLLNWKLYSRLNKSFPTDVVSVKVDRSVNIFKSLTLKTQKNQQLISNISRIKPKVVLDQTRRFEINSAG